MFKGSTLLCTFVHIVKASQLVPMVVVLTVQDALDPVWKLHEQKHVPLRTAAFVYALQNVAKVAKARGYGG